MSPRHAPSLAARVAGFFSRNKAAIIFNVVVLLGLVAALELGLTYALDNPRLAAASPAALNALRIIHDEERVVSIQYLPDCARYDADTTYTLRPGACRFASTEFDTELFNNSAGLRDDESSLHDPEIIVLGDSFAMGWGVLQEETFAQELERRSGMKTLNAGISSFGTVRELRMLSRLDRSKLKAVVIQYCDNDLRENRSFAESGNRLGIMPREEYEARRDKVLSHSYWFGRYANRLRKSASHIMGERFKGLFKDSEPVRSTNADEARWFVNALENGPVDLTGIPVIVLELLPLAGNDTGFVSALKAEKDKPGKPAWIRDMHVLDVSGLLTTDDYYLLDDHITAVGHAKVAALLAEAVREAIVR